MKWSKSKAVALVGVATLLVTAVLFAQPFKEKAGFIFNWFIDDVKYAEIDTTGLKVDNITDLAGTGSPGFSNGLNVDSEPMLVAEYMTATTATGSPAAGKFHSTIIGREPLLDLSKIPSGKFGIERIPVESLTLINGEIGTDGSQVYRLQDQRISVSFNDATSGTAVLDNLRGRHITIDSADDQIEVVFYGTGLNLLEANPEPSGNDKTFDIAIDGGSPVSNNHHGSSFQILRGYALNVVFEAVSGLTLGVHTATIDNIGTGQLLISGFEIVNEATTVAIPAGSIIDAGTKYTTTATTKDLTTFENQFQDGASSGAKTVGGHVVEYFDTDGTIKKDINYVDSAQANLTSADHSDEEVVQRFNFREFGAAQAGDFSTLGTGSSDVLYTLDDDTTNLVGNDVLANPGVLVAGSVTAFVTITFVGSGLDIVRLDAGDGTTPLTSVFIDGIDTTLGVNTTAADYERIEEIVSGLPFGTHLVRFTKEDGSGTHDWGMTDFIIYAPKKPVLSAGQVEIHSYYKTANFVANATAGRETIATGVIRKYTDREIVATGNWSITTDVSANLGGQAIRNFTDADLTSITFFGTGFEFRHNSGTTSSQSVDVDLNGSTNFSTYTTSVYGQTGEISDNPANISLNGAGSVAGNGWSVSGIPLGMQTLTFTNDCEACIGAPGSTRFVDWGAIDIITPTYSYKNNLLNTSDSIVGSISLKNEILIPGATKNKIIAIEGIEGKDIGKFGSFSFTGFTSFASNRINYTNMRELTQNGLFEASHFPFQFKALVDLEVSIGFNARPSAAVNSICLQLNSAAQCETVFPPTLKAASHSMNDTARSYSTSWTGSLVAGDILYLIVNSANVFSGGEKDTFVNGYAKPL